MYRDQAKWTRMSIMATAGSGKFSTDRTIAEYAKVRWGGARRWWWGEGGCNGGGGGDMRRR